MFTNNIIRIFADTLRKYAYILQRDFREVTNIIAHKRASFLSNGIKIFLKNVWKDVEMFSFDMDYYYDTKTSEYFLDTVLCLQISREHIKEYIIFNPIKNHIFYSDNQNIFFNDKKIINVKNTNNIQVQSTNPLFLQNLYICYLFLGAFKEVTILDEHMEVNRFAIGMCGRLPNTIIEKTNEGIRITSKLIGKI